MQVPIHVRGEDRSSLPDVVSGHLRLLQLAARQNVGHGYLRSHFTA
jgi:tRNA threonylcarbamoyladenosine modification (KEOPS) complex  Pcc1 subunit